MTPVDLLIFDLDGTLVDTRQDLTNSVNCARTGLGLPPMSLSDVMALVGDGIRNLLKRSLPKAEAARVDEAFALFRGHYRDHLLDVSDFYPNVKDVLRHFRDKKMAVASNKPEEFSRKIIEELEPNGLFQLVLGGDSLPVMKPHPEPILEILKRLGVPSQGAVMIGDSPADIVAGRAAGVLTCAVTYGYREEGLLLESHPDFLIRDIRELIDLFE